MADVEELKRRIEALERELALPSESGEESQGHPGPVLAELQRLRAENKQLKDQLEKANYRIEHLKHHLGERVDKEYEQSEGKKQ